MRRASLTPRRDRTDAASRADYQWPFYVIYPFYFLAFVGFAIEMVHRMSDYSIKFGTFDEKQIGRDRTPDKSVNHLAVGILGAFPVLSPTSATSSRDLYD